MGAGARAALRHLRAATGEDVVAIGGTHGDEYEGPVGLKNLIGTLDPADVVEGRLIVIPVLNVPAFQAAQRHRRWMART